MLNEHKKVYQQLKNNKKAMYNYKYKTEQQYKQEYAFLKEPDAKALQNTNRNLFQAFQNFFNGIKGKRQKVGYPKFKSKKNKQSYKTNNIHNNIKIDFARKQLKLPKIMGCFSYRDDRTFVGSIKSVVVSKTKSGKYYAAILIRRKVSIHGKRKWKNTK